MTYPYLITKRLLMSIKFSDEIEREANLLLQKTLNDIFVGEDLKIRCYEYFKEKGIDFNFEIENRDMHPITLGMFFLQNKGTNEEFKVLKTGENKGKISFKLDDVRQVKYFCSELDQPLIITICDINSKTIYWEPIQLSSENYLLKADEILNDFSNNNRKGKSIQVYFNPNNTLLINDDLQLGNFKKFISDIESSKEYLTLRNFQKANNINEEEIDKIEIDSNLPIVDQLFTYLKIRFAELHVLPTRFWAESYPFKKGKQQYISYNLLCLSTDNEAVFEYFNSLIIEEGVIKFTEIANISDYANKTTFILETLNRNLVFDIELANTNKRKKIRLNSQRICDCIQCSFGSLKMGNVIKDLYNDNLDIGFIEKQAYVNYKLGNYELSAKLFIQVLAKAIEQKLEIKSFVVKYNLTKLEPLIKYAFSGSEPEKELLLTLKKYKNELYFEALKVKTGKGFCKWILGNRFFSDFQYVILEENVKLRDYQFSQLYGGRSSNSFVWQVYSNYAILESFLNINHVVFDHYAEFGHLSEIYIESMLASYSIEKSMYSRLIEFDDWILQMIIFQVSPDDINKYIKRYFVRTVKYKKTATSSNDFINMAKNLLTEDKELVNLLEKRKLDDNFYFHDKYTNILNNVIVLSSLVIISDDEVNEVGRLLNKFFDWQIFLRVHRSLKYIIGFINRAGERITNNLLLDFFYTGVNSSDFHDEGYFTSIANVLENKNVSIIFTDKLKESIDKMFSETCSVCNTKHDSTMLIQFYRLASELNDKEYIKEKIIAKLNAKFDWRLYYLSAIYEILGIEENNFNSLLNYKIPVGNRPTFFGNYSRDEQNRDFRIGAIINLCFKYNINLKEQRFEHLKGYDPYYDWLLDMENYDYSNFNPRWVSEYNTVYYFNKMKNIPFIKNEVIQYLKKNHDPLLKDNFINIYTDVNL